jgi:hypothetical protein
MLYSDHMTTNTKDNVCWDRRFIVTALGAALVVVAAALASTQCARGSAARIALALVEGAATAWVVLMPWRMMRRLDELQRRVQLEALAAAFFVTGIVGAGYGFLEAAGLPHIDWGSWLWPFMAFVWGGATIVAARRYR